MRDLPLTRDEQQGDPRLAYGTGSLSYNAGMTTSINDTNKSAKGTKKLNLATMYNLKEIHQSKTRTNAEEPNEVFELHAGDGVEASKDSNGATNIGNNQGAFSDKEFLNIFDGFKLYRNGKIRTR